MNMVARVGIYGLAGWRELCYLTAIAWRALSIGARPRYWKRTLRTELSRQIFSTGVGSALLISRVALAVGISVVAQALVWFSKISQEGMLGPLLVTVLIREATPVLTNLVVIARNGTAITTELATMKVSGEVRVLDSQGLDPFIYLVVPRVLGLAISVFCLSGIFILISIVSGYFCGLLLGANVSDPWIFFTGILISITQVDVISLLTKAIFPALLTGAICCAEGLRVAFSAREIARATRRALDRSIAALFVMSALISLLTYL